MTDMAAEPTVWIEVHPFLAGRFQVNQGGRGMSTALALTRDELVLLEVAIARVLHGDGRQAVTDAQVQAFKRAWGEANDLGQVGQRARAGLEAAAALAPTRCRPSEAPTSLQVHASSPAVKALAEHLPDEGLNTCMGKACVFEVWEVPFSERAEAFGVHQVEVLLAAGHLAAAAVEVPRG